MNDEFQAIAECIMEQRPDIDLHNVDSLQAWFQRCYINAIKDNSTLYSCMTTNSVYKELTLPLQTSENGTQEPSFNNRYLTEDIPFGLVVMRGIAEIAGVKTPHIDLVIKWSQEKIGKEYLKDGELTGHDLHETRCPQRYGLFSLDAILGS